MPFDFLTPRIERLSADGTLSVVNEGTVLGRLFQRPVLLLARDLCSFSRFDATALPKSKRRLAAQLHAQAVAPYVRSNLILSKSPTAFGIWWWDTDRLETLTATHIARSRLQICPETLCQPTPISGSETWRIVRLATGYEAQLWQDKALIASAWSPHRFDATSWSSFVRQQRKAVDTPEQIPTPVDLPVSFDPRQIQTPIKLSREQLVMLAGSGAIMASLSLAAFLLGQSWEIGKEVDRVEAETARIRQATPRPVAIEDLGDAKKTLVAYQALESRTSPLSSAGAAIGILAYHDISALSVRSELESLSLVVSYSHLGQAETLTEEFQNSGYFYDIRPRSDRSAQTLTFEMSVREEAPPLGAIQ